MTEMTEVAKGVATHQRLVALLTQENARYRVVSHDAVGKCEAVSEIRGTALGQGAKALVCKVKGNGVNQHVLAILAADQQADLSQLASHLGGLRASLASPAEVDTLAHCPNVFHRAGSCAIVSTIWRIFGCADTGNCNCSCGCCGSSSNNTRIRRCVGICVLSRSVLRASDKINSRHKGEIFNVQQRSGMTTAAGSINKKHSSAPAVT